MATVNYSFRGSKNSGSLTIRFIHTRAIDLKCSTNIIIPKKSWDSKKQRIKNVGEMKSAGKLNEKLLNLEASLISQFSLDYMEGLEIDSNWLKKSVLKFFNRPDYELHEKKKMENKVYFINFSKKFIEDLMKTGKWKNAKTKKPLSKTVVNHYENTLNKLEDFEAIQKKRYKVREINLDFCEDLCEYLLDEKGYGANYVNRLITRIKFFCARAEEDNLEVDHVYKSSNFSSPTEETLDPYLNEEEIKSVCNLKIEDQWLDDIRDWFVIGLRTGLRIVDILGAKDWPELSLEHIHEKYIQRKTKKTGKMVATPIHPDVRRILKKRGGALPKKISHKHFNENIKIICNNAGIDKEIYASVKDPKTNRKIKNWYKKYEAVSSHICRRSFATNNLDKIPVSWLMQIGGWNTESAFRKYIKKSGTEYAEQLNLIYESEEQLQNAS